MSREISNAQSVSNFFTIFTLMLIGFALVTVAFSLFFLIGPIGLEKSPNYQNCSVDGNEIVPSVMRPSSFFFQNCANESNTTTGMNRINQFFNSSNILTIYNSNFQKGGLVEILVSNFAILLTLIGVFSLYCYFFFNITFNANVISEYPISQQQNLKIFLQIQYLMLILLPIFMILIYLYHLSIKPVEQNLIFTIFIVAIFSSAFFFEYDKEVRTNFDNMVQFAALRDSRNLPDLLIYFISILCFVFPLLLILYGIASNFNIFSIIFTTGFIFLIVWQINIIRNAPRSIFELKIRDHNKHCQGILLTGLDKDIIQILVKDDSHNDEIIRIPRTSIEYIRVNRSIKSTEIINPPDNFYQAIRSVWNSLGSLKNFLIALVGFDLGFLLGFILFLVFGVVVSNISMPLQVLIPILFVFSLFLGGIYGRAYHPLFDSGLLETLKNFLNTLIDFKLAFLVGVSFFPFLVVLRVDSPPQWMTVIFFLVALISGFSYGQDSCPEVNVNSEDWRRFYAFKEELLSA